MDYLRGLFHNAHAEISDIRPFIERLRSSGRQADAEFHESSKAVQKLRRELEPPFEKDMFPLGRERGGMGNE